MQIVLVADTGRGIGRAIAAMAQADHDIVLHCPQWSR